MHFLSQRHPEVYQQYQNEKNQMKKGSQMSEISNNSLTQKGLDDAIVRLITKKILPVSLVEDSYFREFVLSKSFYKLFLSKFVIYFFRSHRATWIQIRR